MLIHHPLEHWSRRTPDAVCASLEDGTALTYAEAGRQADGVARALAGAGLGRGDRVGMLSTNAINVPVALFGSAKAGCAVVPLNPRLASDELRYIVDDAQMRVVYAGRDLIPAIEAVREQVPSVEHFVTFADDAPDGWVAWSEWIARDGDLGDLSIEDEDIATQIYTSGTTGRPKGAMMSHRATSAFLHQWQIQGMRLSTGDTFYLPMPVTLAAGFNCAINAWYQGATVMMDEFDPERVAAALDRGMTATCMAPVMIKRCIEADGADARSYDELRWILYGAAPIPAPVLARAIKVLGCDFYQALGQTEAPTITLLTPDDHRRALTDDEALLGSVGRLQMGAEVSLRDPLTGDPVGTKEPGEIWVRGSAVMSGYWGNQETIDQLAAGQWHRTSDLAYVDDSGYFFVVDRLNDTVVTGGYNVYPREVERVLEAVEGIAQVAVFGVDDEEWGQSVVAAVVAAPGTLLAEADLVDHCRGSLAGYKVPRRFVFLEQLPINANGKILKRTLRATWTEKANTVAAAT